MCNRYVAPAQGDIERHWRLGAQQPAGRWAPGVYPRAPGPFIRAHKGQPGQRELVAGQWALVPHFAKSAKLSYQTNNARSEEVAQKASYRTPWHWPAGVAALRGGVVDRCGERLAPAQ